MKTKTVYQLTPAGLLAGTAIASESPLEPGVYHLPAGCIETAPPEAIPDGKWPRWNGTTWDWVTRPTVRDPSAATVDPVAKLRAFLADNPDVANLLDPQ